MRLGLGQEVAGLMAAMLRARVPGMQGKGKRRLGVNGARDRPELVAAAPAAPAGERWSCEPTRTLRLCHGRAALAAGGYEWTRGTLQQSQFSQQA